MQEFWKIVSNWSPIGQGIFFLIVMGGTYSFLTHLAFYASVLLHGWPAPGVLPVTDN